MRNFTQFKITKWSTQDYHVKQNDVLKTISKINSLAKTKNHVKLKITKTKNHVKLKIT